MVLATVAILSLCSSAVSLPVSVSTVHIPASAVGKPLEASAPAHLAISLRQRDTEGLRALLVAQQDPGSKLFHQWLTPASFGERFGQPQAAYTSVQQWLEAGGFNVQTYPNRIFLEATGTAAQVKALLGVELHWAQTEGGLRYRTVVGTPTAPAPLAALLLNIQGLDTHPRFHRRLQLGQPPNDFDSFGPQDLRRFYDIQPLLDQGYIASGLTTAVLGADTTADELPQPADINYFYQNGSDSSAQFVLDELPNPNNDLDPEPGARQELEMDPELQTVAAPGLATVTEVLPPAEEIFSTGVNFIVNNLPDVVTVSTSYGTCETESGLQASDYQAAEQLLSQGIAEGQTWFSASGDSGVDDCQDGSGASADFPSTIPEMFAAGGASNENPSIFDSNGAVTAYNQEVVWNDGAGGGAGGGWMSIGYTKPTWQLGVGPGATDGARDEPDIALLAEPNPGVIADNTVAGQLSPNGGTSDAAPLSAGIFALIGDRLGGRLGLIHPTMYALGLAQLDGGTRVFHDITQGNNSYDKITGATAVAGYDLASGWGSLDVAVLATAWPLPLPNFGPDAGPDAGAEPDAGAPDAGSLAPYNPCALLACDGGAVCETIPEGPAACTLFCNTVGANTCPLGDICYSNALPDAGFCTPGCTSNSDCPSDQACAVCEQSCVAPGNTGAQIGDPCEQDTDCPTGDFCLTAQDGIPGGYCTANCYQGCACPGGASCWTSPPSVGYPPLCLTSCDPTAAQPCTRQGYVCQEMDDGTNGCQPPCQTDMDCYGTIGMTCDPATGICPGPDAGTAPVDAGQPVGDAGTPHVDAGGSMPDSGTSVQADAGVSTAPDAGTVSPSGGCGCGGLPGGADWSSVSLLLLALVELKRRR
jgi:hypothetical protein